ncbi:hypothetical protein [Kitasatospora sp. NPDC050463]|uniref:hypothetical protein n=1 Tax=Kitasatospora sp. NPDC050463 TaxID=3155786 RepID=UPI0033CB0D68
MTTIFGLIISFATTGEIGAFRLGMPGEEAVRLLGRDTGLAAPAQRGSGESVGFKDGSLEIWAGSDRTVWLLGFDAVGTEGRFRTASCIDASAQETIEAPRWGELIKELEQLGCMWRNDDSLTIDDQLAIRTEADVAMVFARPEPPANEWVLASLYKSAGVS